MSPLRHFSKMKPTLLLLLTLLLLTLFCRSVYENYDQGSAPKDPAILQQSGYTFRLQDAPKRRMFDTLSLKSGTYMIQFQLPSTGDAGYARCELTGGKTYGFKVTERRYLPEIGGNALIGACVPK